MTTTSGFIDFNFGTGDENVGKKSTRFKAEGDRSYRVSFVAFKDLNEDGTPNIGDDDSIRFAGCERIYKQGVGYILYKGPAYAEFGTPRHAVGTVICVWPCDKDGDLDTASFKKGTGWQVQPWVFSPDKYAEIKRKHKRFPLTQHDLTLSCTDTQYQKITFSSERDCLLTKLLDAKSEELRAVGLQIVQQAQAVMEGIHRDLARDLTIDEIRESLGDEVVTPTGNSHAVSNVEDLLDDVL